MPKRFKVVRAVLLGDCAPELVFIFTVGMVATSGEAWQVYLPVVLLCLVGIYYSVRRIQRRAEMLGRVFQHAVLMNSLTRMRKEKGEEFSLAEWVRAASQQVVNAAAEEGVDITARLLLEDRQSSPHCTECLHDWHTAGKCPEPIGDRTCWCAHEPPRLEHVVSAEAGE